MRAAERTSRIESGSGPTQTRTRSFAAQVAEIKFESNADALHLPPNQFFGEVMGINVNAQKHVFVFSRTGERSTVHGATAAQLFEFGPDGAFIREIGQNLYGFAFAHTVEIDKQGNIWTSDEGTNMVVKFSPAGKVLMVLGRRAEAVEELPRLLWIEDEIVFLLNLRGDELVVGRPVGPGIFRGPRGGLPDRLGDQVAVEQQRDHLAPGGGLEEARG